MGEFKEVHVPSRARQELRELVRLYTKVVGDVTRAKNRIKAKFRQHGVPVTGREVYKAEHREVWLRKLDRASVRFMAETMYQHLDAAEAVRDRLANRLKGMLRHTRAYRQMCSLPGVGAVTASILVAVIDEPERFPDKRKLWKYAGLSVSSPWSGSPGSAHRGGSPSGNRLLKYAAMHAARHSLRGGNRFARHHARMVEAGIAPAMAEKTIARNLLATALALWKGGTEYREAT
jgi:transposase